MLSDDNQQPRSSLPRPTAPTFRKERLEHLVSQDSSIPFSKPVLRAHCEACALHPAHHSIHGPLIKSYQKPTTAFLLKQKQSNPNHHTQQQYWRPSGAVKHGLHPVDSSPSTKYSNNSPLPHSHSLSLRRRSSAHALHGTSSSSSFSGRSKLARKLSASSLDANFINSWRPSGKVNYPHPPFDIEPIKLGNSNITGHRWFSEPRNSSGSKVSM